MQLRMPGFAQNIPEHWAIRFRWYTDARKPGAPLGPRPHVSLAINACIAGVASLPDAEQKRILRAGIRRIIKHDAALPNREKMRLVRSSTIRPMGVGLAP